MKYVDEYRDEALCRRYAEAIAAKLSRPWRIMEVCGGQTHAIVRFGIDKLLPPSLSLLHGPGCPVCVTPIEVLDRAMAIASRPEVIFCSFGDMLRVPGSEQDLFAAKSAGADVRMVYSPLDALQIAEKHPDKQVVFFAVGFETTAPANAMAIREAHRRGMQNFSLLVSHVLVPPALEAILSASERNVDAFLAAGHVCAVMGFNEYGPIAQKHHVPIVVTGFEPADILQGISMCVSQLEEGRTEVENQYTRAVRKDGNESAQRVVSEVFCVVPRKWRGIGDIPQSGLGIREKYAAFDAEKRFAVSDIVAEEPAECKSGLVLQGILKPSDCPAFGVRCTPERPLGATMVSSEGACAAYYRYRRAGL
ncbi:MAG: hydrogenase formation protein HypD [Polyangiaceae bacterium]|nr:hydrogenase formation protein HypD [Polyangiaceae bacterium]